MKFVFAKGQPKFRWFPRFTKWGANISIYWLGKELVYIGTKRSTKW